MPLPKPCRSCQKIFLPQGKFCYYCEKCLIKRKEEKYGKTIKVDSQRLKTPKNPIPVKTTTPKIKKVKRCIKCGKIIREENKSGLCGRCYGNKYRREKYLDKKIQTERFK